jgi:hypothetical protein
MITDEEQVFIEMFDKKSGTTRLAVKVNTYYSTIEPFDKNRKPINRDKALFGTRYKYLPYSKYLAYKYLNE